MSIVFSYIPINNIFETYLSNINNTLLTTVNTSSLNNTLLTYIKVKDFNLTIQKIKPVKK